MRVSIMEFIEIIRLKKERKHLSFDIKRLMEPEFHYTW